MPDNSDADSDYDDWGFDGDKMRVIPVQGSVVQE